MPRKNHFSALVLLLIVAFGFIVIGSTSNNIGRSFFIDSAYSQKSTDTTGGTTPTTKARATTTGGPYMGVDLNGLATSRSQAKTTNVILPTNYYNDSFRIISQGGMNHVRLVLYWEAYEKNPAAFIAELNIVAQTADKYGLKVMYDNHQFHTSSWLDPSRGIGFPFSLFKVNSTAYPAGGGGQTKDAAAKTWWTNWWNRSIKDASGVDGWTLQANFLKKIVTTVDRHPSTLGYEILSEPQVHSISQWSKIGTYNTFMVNQLRTLTHKTIAYSMNIPIDLKSPIGVTPQNLAKMAPTNKTNVIFKISMYGSPSSSTFQASKLRVLVQARQITGTPLYVGEWNNVKRENTIDEEGQIVSKINPKLSDINQTEAIQMVQTFKRIGAWGAAYWIWNFQSHIVSNYNLIVVISHAAPLKTTKYFDIVKTSYATVYGDTINPQIPVTSTGTATGTTSSKSPSPPSPPSPPASSSSTTTTISAKLKAELCNPSNPRLKVVNATEARICNIPKTVKNTTTSSSLP
jgi:Cellulase (glycosyl hydrolase family 5)